MNQPVGPFQSVSVVRGLLAGAGLFPSRRLGQSFLIDRHAMERLVASAELTEEDLVLEVGTGTGGLTGYLLAQAGHVVTVEIDSRLADIARGVLGYDSERLTLVAADALRSKHELDPEMTDALLGAWQTGRFARFKLVANLPYVIATPLVADLRLFRLRAERMCFTVQRELADRMLASPGGPEYGWLTVLIASLSRAELLGNISPTCFYPRPKVTSSIVRLFPVAEFPQPQRLEAFTDLVNYLFQHRRKTLAHNLRDLAKRAGAEWSAEEVLAAASVTPMSRAQELSTQAFWRMTDALLARTRNEGGKDD